MFYHSSIHRIWFGYVLFFFFFVVVASLFFMHTVLPPQQRVHLIYATFCHKLIFHNIKSFPYTYIYKLIMLWLFAFSVQKFFFVHLFAVFLLSCSLFKHLITINTIFFCIIPIGRSQYRLIITNIITDNAKKKITNTFFLKKNNYLKSLVIFVWVDWKIGYRNLCEQKKLIKYIIIDLLFLFPIRRFFSSSTSSFCN